jgi:hypothetical protein
MNNKSMLEAFEQVYGINARKMNQSQKHYHGWQKKAWKQTKNYQRDYSDNNMV